MLLTLFLHICALARKCVYIRVCVSVGNWAWVSSLPPGVTRVVDHQVLNICALFSMCFWLSVSLQK